MVKEKIISLIICFLLLWNNSAFQIELTSILYYGFLIFSVFLILPNNNIFKNLNLFFLSFIFFILVSLLLNEIDPVFQSRNRFIAFLSITLLIGPLISSRNLLIFRNTIFNYLNKSFIIFSSLSYLFLVSGIYTGRKIRGDFFDRVDFTGLFSHSMILSPISGLAILSLTYNLTNKSYSKPSIIVQLSLLILCFMSLITSGSRIALIATIFAIITLLLKTFKKKYLVIFKYILPVSIIASLTFNLWGDNADFLLSKFAISDESIVYSRFSKWENRLLEIEKSPIYGIGFSSVDSNNIYYDMSSNGTVEPGSSWLAIMSMTGIFGLISFLFLISSLISRMKESSRNNFLYSYGFFFMIHFIAEGYIFASGSILFFTFWLLIGLISDTNNFPKLIR